MAGAQEIRAKEARIQLTVDGIRLGGSWSTIHDFVAKPDATITKKRFTGEARSRGDIEVNGWDLTWKTEKRDHLWSRVWKLIQDAEQNSRPLPDIVMTVSYRYRDGSGIVNTTSFQGDMVMKMDENSIPVNGYQGNSWSAFCGFDTESQSG